MKKERKFWKIAAIFIMIFLFMTSAAQAVVKINLTNDLNINSSPVETTYDETYEWIDDFGNAQKIDLTISENYIVENGKVQMYGTYPMWNDASFTRMKVVSLSSSVTDSDVAIKIIVHYDSDMRSDYGDVRFKFQNDDAWLTYWIEEKNPESNDPYAIFWLKIPTLPSGSSKMYMFYGKPSATEQSNYWAVFDEDSWTSEHAHDERVTNHWYKEGAWDPDVCWGNNKFLVTWEEGTAFWLTQGTIFQQQIRGCYYNKNGDATSNRFDIVDEPTDPLETYRYENPSSCYGSGGNFLVAYNRYTDWSITTAQFTNMDIEGAIVNSASDGASKRFTICDADRYQADPCVAWDPGNGRFFVVWEDGRNGMANNYDIYGRMFSTSGSPVGGEKVLIDRPNSQCEPWIAFDKINNHYIVVWEEGVNSETGPFSIWGQIFDVNGNPLGSEQRLSASGSGGTDYNFPCVAYCELLETFLVTWNEADISSGDYSGHVWGKMLDENGNVVLDTFKIANGEFCRTDVVPYLSTSFFVAYDSWSGSSGDIWGKMVNADGSVNPYTIRLSDNQHEAADWVNIGSSGDKIFVAWEDERVVYQEPFDMMPDIYTNVWSLNTPSGSDVSVTFGDEKTAILDAVIYSIEIAPTNWQEWYEFDADKSGDVEFDIVDGQKPSTVLKSNVNPGRIDSISKGSIRLRARFSRSTPASSPELDMWMVSYIGKDTEPPRTTLDNIDGVKGLNEYYLSEGVTIWLKSEDFPADTGSGVENTYYKLNNGGTQTYSIGSGIQLSVSQGTDWKGQWDVNFWSVDKKGNVENKNKPENKITIRIDADRPEVEITSPANEEKVETPFWVKATAQDNVGIERVEFDIEPFGEREGLPFKDDTPPYEWFCEEEGDSSPRIRILGEDDEPDDPEDPTDPTVGVNVMVRAQAFDYSGQTWIHEVWVHITNWDDESDDSDEPDEPTAVSRVLINKRPILEKLKFGIAFDKKMEIDIPTPTNADRVEFIAARLLTRRQFRIVDSDLSDGCSAIFNIPTGLYKITTIAYSEDKQIEYSNIARIFYLAK